MNRYLNETAPVLRFGCGLLALGFGQFAGPVEAAINEGSASVRVTDDTTFDRNQFADFAKDSLARYFKTGGKVTVTRRATGQNAIQDIELVGPSRCLSSGLIRSGWQKLRFEFSYRIDDAYLAKTAQVKFEIVVRLVSGEVADFQQDYEPPPDRFKQVASAELTDLANKLGGFMRQEMSKSCFEQPTLKYCASTLAESCQ